MSEFRTEVKIPQYGLHLDHEDKIMMIGSCFSENIGLKLKERCFNIDINPFGILYNPMSVANSLEILMKKQKFTEKDIFSYNGHWNSFFHHSRYSGSNKEKVLLNINSGIEKSSDALRRSKFLFITFGTSWVYEYKKSGLTVSNCHKIPGKEFRRYRLTPEDITKRWEGILSRIKSFNPNLNIIFTVSPIRHIKDGIHENQISKSVLFLAIDSLINSRQDTRLEYFPSYELVMDELRDYRFYAEDMLHLSNTAVNFIWEKFSKSLLSKRSKDIIPEVMKLQKALNHTPFDRESVEYHKFINNNIKRIDSITLAYPFVNIKDVLEAFLEKKA